MHFQVFVIKYKVIKSIIENFQSAFPEIWECCFLSDLEMFNLFSLLLNQHNTNCKFQTVDFHNCFQTIFPHFKPKHLKTQFQNISDIKLVYFLSLLMSWNFLKMILKQLEYSKITLVFWSIWKLIELYKIFTTTFE